MSLGIIAVMMVGVSPRPAAAQQTVSDVLSFLLTTRSIATGNFVHDEEAAAATRDTISGFLLLDLARLPINSSPGGFTYRLNPTLGTVERASDSFGPFFIERSLTAGARQLSVGLSFQNSTFDTIDGRNLRDGTLIATASRFRDQAQPFDVETVSLQIRANTFTLLADYGVTDRLDLGVAVPFVTVKLSGQRIDTYRGQPFLQAVGSASASGPGDVAIRAKYNVLRSGGSGVAVGGEVRLPTGNDKNLLGAGKPAVKPLVIGSFDQGPLGVHGNLAYTFSELSNEFNYGGAATLAGTDRFTLVGELVGRHVAKLGRLSETSEPNRTIAGVDTIRLASVGKGAERVVAVAGFKWNLIATFLLSGYIVRPLTTTGLNARWVPSLTVDYSFGR
jgi:hypothetical protein